MYVSDKDKKNKEHKDIKDVKDTKDKDKIDKVKRKIFNSANSEESSSPTKKKVKLVVDLPSQESKDLENHCDQQNVEPMTENKIKEEPMTEEKIKEHPIELKNSAVDTNETVVNSAHIQNGNTVDSNVT